jgi:hypothetical protein
MQDPGGVPGWPPPGLFGGPAFGLEAGGYGLQVRRPCPGRCLPHAPTACGLALNGMPCNAMAARAPCRHLGRGAHAPASPSASAGTAGGVEGSRAKPSAPRACPPPAAPLPCSLPCAGRAAGAAPQSVCRLPGVATGRATARGCGSGCRGARPSHRPRTASRCALPCSSLAAASCTCPAMAFRGRA